MARSDLGGPKKKKEKKKKGGWIEILLESANNSSSRSALALSRTTGATLRSSARIAHTVFGGSRRTQPSLVLERERNPQAQTEEGRSDTASIAKTAGDSGWSPFRLAFRLLRCPVQGSRCFWGAPLFCQSRILSVPARVNTWKQDGGGLRLASPAGIITSKQTRTSDCTTPKSNQGITIVCKALAASPLLHPPCVRVFSSEQRSADRKKKSTWT